jgi:N-dimethylarginine dimethylaminohydrolase
MANRLKRKRPKESSNHTLSKKPFESDNSNGYIVSQSDWDNFMTFTSSSEEWTQLKTDELQEICRSLNVCRDQTNPDPQDKDRSVKQLVNYFQKRKDELNSRPMIVPKDLMTAYCANPRVQCGHMDLRVGRGQFQLKPIEGVHFEGGDVLLDDDYIFIGISHPSAEHGVATTEIAIKTFQLYFPTKKIIGVSLAKETLHLDIVFNILPFNRSCVVCPSGVVDFDQFNAVLQQRFQKVYEVTTDQAESYVCNFMNAGPNKMIVSDSEAMRKLVKLWRKDSSYLEVRYVNFEYIYAFLGGSIRCASLPVRRIAQLEIVEPSLCVTNETDNLQVCVVGKLTKDKETIVCQEAYGKINTLLRESKLTRQGFLSKVESGLDALVHAMESFKVIVLRPDLQRLMQVPACNVIFCRDVATVIDTKLFAGQLHLPHREGELQPTLESINAFFFSPMSR